MKRITCTEIRQKTKAPDRILRAAIYSRVSTDMEIQEGSFDMQNRYFLNMIESDPRMVLAGLYGDFGKSGRSISGRGEFQQMVQDCIDGKIDVIYTKNISRFARNFIDCMETLKILKEHHVRVIFDENGIDTADMKSELLLAILVSIAEEESNSISQNLQWAIDERAKKGIPLTKPSYGYRRQRKSTVWAVEKSEAKRIELIFDWYLDGASFGEISDELNAIEELEGTQQKWSKERVKYALTNVAYRGDILTGKRVRIGRKTKVNEGEKDQYYLEGHHPGIISRDVFDKVQKKLKKNRRAKKTA